MFGEERQAERVIRERNERLEALSKLVVPKGQTTVILLAIRSPIRHKAMYSALLLTANSRSFFPTNGT